MIIQVLYSKIDNELLNVLGIIKKLKGRKEIIFTRGNRNEIFIDSYKVWEKGEDKSKIIEGFYDIKIYRLINNALIGISS